MESPYTFKDQRFSSHSILLKRFPPPGAGARVLDVGGGEGYLGRELTRRGYDVTCVAKPGTVAFDFPKNVCVIEADLDFDRPELGAAFNAIVCGDVLEHLRDPLAVLQWLRSILESSGRIEASLPNGTHAWVRANVLFGRFPKEDRGLFDRTHLHFFSLSGWRNLLHSAGFELSLIEPTAVPVGLLAPAWCESFVIRGAEMISYGLSRIWRTLFAYQFIVAARRLDGSRNGL